MDSHPIITTARELQPLIRQHLEEGERRARLTKEVVTAVGRAGLFRLYAPQEVGGLEVPPPVSLAVMEAVAAADPAVGWYMGNSVPICLAAASLPERERVEVFADPDLNFGFSGAPLGRAVPMDGGYRVSGQWPVVTGSEDAKWCALAGLVMDGETPRQLGDYPDGRLFLIPTAAIDIAPTWQAAAAMRGTGSNAVSVHDVFVPEVLAYTPAKPRLIDRPLFRLPLSVAFGSLPAAIICGIFAAALESATEALSTKVAAYSGKTLRDQPPIQELIAECSGALRAARAGLFEASGAIWALVEAGQEVPNRLRAELHASSFHAAEMGREMISRLYARGTRAAFMQGNPVERALRNIHAIVFGFESGRNLQHAAGRVLLGGEPLDPSF